MVLSSPLLYEEFHKTVLNVCNIIGEPGKVETVQTKAREVYKGFHLVDNCGLPFILEFIGRGEHLVSQDGLVRVVVDQAL